ncbi:MAG: hypothetical protein HZA61_17150 [Candidatus Eisenbacteria bacterium]|uniref:Uncharacterized protein n=1 Tax=Eiseniibacteriota bacterium TaxID=2212470 RepID=A0A933SFJ9_UNCEI|nr:hypothetical protein [Candidatus Eisenbacteria bacterium]
MIWIAPLAVVGFTAFAVLGAWVVMTLWNWLTPGLFGWPTLRLPQALGLLVLCRILFGGFGMHGGGPRGAVKRRMFERWEGMSDEERAKFREGMRGTPEC